MHVAAPCSWARLTFELGVVREFSLQNFRTVILRWKRQSKRSAMFSFFKRKQSQVDRLIASDGINHAAKRFAQILARKLNNRDVAYRFILQELDGASKGNAASAKFVRESGIAASEFKDALTKDDPEVDGPEGPQMFLLGLCLQISSQVVMAEFRCKVDDEIMRLYGFGRYEKVSTPSSPNLSLGRQDEITKKRDEIANAILVAANRGGPQMLNAAGSQAIAREALCNLDDEDLLHCSTSVACFFALAQLAESANREGNEVIAKYISRQCKVVSLTIFELPNSAYSDVEIGLVDASIDILKRVEGYSEG